MQERVSGERKDSEKQTHEAARYENPSRHEDGAGTQDCDDCKNYIASIVPRCKHVKRPISPEAWCKHFVRIKPEEPE